MAWSNFWGGQDAYALQNNRPSRQRNIEKMFRGQSLRVVKALMQGLIGATSGSNVTDTRKRIQAVQTLGSIDNLGGKQTVETVSLINRNTTAADVTNLKKYAGSRASYPSSYPVDKAGNGGGGKVGI
jgi:hypothetical protein